MGEFFVYSFFFGALLLLFPIRAGAEVYFDAAENRAWFCISLFRLRLFGGYAELRGEGIVFHLTQKKAVILSYSQLSGARKKFEITKGVQLMRLHRVMEFGGAHNAAMMAFAALFSAAGGAVYAVLKEMQPALSYKSRAIFYPHSCLKGSMELVALMNGLVILTALAKMGMEGVSQWIRQRRWTIFSKKLRKN